MRLFCKHMVNVLCDLLTKMSSSDRIALATKSLLAH